MKTPLQKIGLLSSERGAAPGTGGAASAAVLHLPPARPPSPARRPAPPCALRCRGAVRGHGGGGRGQPGVAGEGADGRQLHAGARLPVQQGAVPHTHPHHASPHPRSRKVSCVWRRPWRHACRRGGVHLRRLALPADHPAPLTPAGCCATGRQGQQARCRARPEQGMLAQLRRAARGVRIPGAAAQGHGGCPRSVCWLPSPLHFSFLVRPLLVRQLTHTSGTPISTAPPQRRQHHCITASAVA